MITTDPVPAKQAIDRKAERLREQRFASAYIRHNGNGAAAVRSIGYAGTSPQLVAHRMLQRPRVRSLVDRRRKQLEEDMQISEAQITRGIVAAAFSDVRQLFNADGTMRLLTELDDATAAAIASVEVDELWGNSNDDGRKQIGVTLKVKLWPKVAALDLLCKKLGLLKAQKMEHDIGDSLAELIRQSMQPRAAAPVQIDRGQTIDHE